MRNNSQYDAWLAILTANGIETQGINSTFDAICALLTALGSEYKPTSVFDALLELKVLLTGNTDILSSRYDILLYILKSYESTASEQTYPTEFDAITKLVDYISLKKDFKGIVLSALEDSTVVLNARNTGHIQYALENSRDWSDATQGEQVTVPQGKKLYLRNYYTSAPSAPTASAENAQIYVASGDCDVHANVADYWMYSSSEYTTHNYDYVNSCRNLISGNVSTAYLYCRRSAHNGVYNYLLWSNIPCDVTLSSEDPHTIGNVQCWSYALGKCSHIKTLNLNGFNIVEGWHPWNTIHWLETQVDKIYINKKMYDLCRNWVRTGDTLPYTAEIILDNTTVVGQPTFEHLHVTNASRTMTELNADPTFLNFWHVQITADAGRTWFDITETTNQEVLDAMNSTTHPVANAKVYLRAFRKPLSGDSTSAFTSGVNIKFAESDTTEHILGGALCYLSYSKDFTEYTGVTYLWMDSLVNRPGTTTYGYHDFFVGCDFTQIDVFKEGYRHGIPGGSFLTDRVEPRAYSFYRMFKACQRLHTVTGAITLYNDYDPTRPSMLYTTSGSYVCYGMFTDCVNLVNAPELPMMDLKPYAYSYMFQRTAITKAPNLPATTLPNEVYHGMFHDAVNLREVQAFLPATSGTSQCYKTMFMGCTSLETAPQIMLTTIPANGCESMYEGCTSLKVVPDMSSVTEIMSTGCQKMFYGCSSLVDAPNMPNVTAFNASACKNMYQNATSLVNGPELSKSLITLKGTAVFNTMFQGCTSLEKGIPEINYEYASSVTSAGPTTFQNCYNGCSNLTQGTDIKASTVRGQDFFQMYQKCTSLEVAPTFDIQTIGKQSFYYTFDGCSKLKATPSLNSIKTFSDQSCFAYCFRGCTSLTTITDMPDVTNLTAYCYQRMFEGCTSLTQGVDLPATTLVSNCYNGLYYNCSGLVDGGEIFGENLVTSCYNGLFYGCTSLLNVTLHLKATSPAPASTYCSNWFGNVKTAGHLDIIGGDESWGRVYNLPSNWTISYLTEPETNPGGEEGGFGGIS